MHDKYRTQNCGFLNLLEYGDTVLADRVSIIWRNTIPSFTKGKSQLSQQEVEGSQQLAKVRIHVESLGR